MCKYLICFVIIILIIILAISFAVGKYIISYVFNPIQKNFEIIKSQDSSFPQGFTDYESLWERHPFEIKRDQANIKGEYIENPKAESKTKKVIVICHGHTACRASDLKYGRMFYRLGYNLVIFDERYFGESIAPRSTLGDKERYDIAEIIDFSRSIFGENCFIGLHGESMGAASVLLASTLRSVDFIIADCPFANTKELLLSIARKRVGILAKPCVFAATILGRIRKYDLTKVNPIDAVKETDIPICFIHGGADSYIPCEHSKRMYEISKNPLNELHIIDGANHAKSVEVDLEGYPVIMEKFVRKVEIASGKIQI